MATGYHAGFERTDRVPREDIMRTFRKHDAFYIANGIDLSEHDSSTVQRAMVERERTMRERIADDYDTMPLVCPLCLR